MFELDHLVYAVPDLDCGAGDIERLLGVAATPGGAHPGLGTRNVLIGLGQGAYLEIIGPDPDQAEPPRSRPFGLDQLEAPRLVTWAVRPRRPESLEELLVKLRAEGLDLGAARAMSRRTPTGELLEWRLALPSPLLFDGCLPFLIDWGRTAHPALRLEQQVGLQLLRVEHPEADALASSLRLLALETDVDVNVSGATRPALVARLETADGSLELR